MTTAIKLETDGRRAEYLARARLVVPDRGTIPRPLPTVGTRIFTEERDRAFAADAPTGSVPLDASADLDLPYPATTPVMLSRYIVLRPAEPFEHELIASGELYYVLKGAGATRNGEDEFAWRAGDAFALPGGGQTRHIANEPSVLYLVTNEPELCFAGLGAPARDRAKVEPVLYSREAIEEALQHVDRTDGVTAEFVSLTNAAMATMRTALPSITAGVNTLQPGKSQRPHRHNAAALTLCLECEGVWSMVDGVRYDWSPNAVLVTPPMAVHAHHNDGTRLMVSFVNQDGGLFHNCRISGFAFAD